jgi:hypothetical protein
MMEMKALQNALTAATKDFVKEKRRAAASGRDQLSYAQTERLRERETRDVIKTAAFKFMQAAYLHASDGGKLPANARQIMYACRPLVLDEIGKCWKQSSTFTQQLLPEYLKEHPAETASWDVTYDARGHFVEPHVRRKLGIGTLDVRSYVGSWRNGAKQKRDDIDINELYPTRGPKNRYRYALFIEKEGFNPLLQRSGLAEKYDLGIFSSKGQSVTAARQLVDALAKEGVTILILHDFDTYGHSIAHNLVHDTDRYTFEVEPDVIDLGLRLSDVENLKLESEPVVFRQKKDPSEKLWDYIGVTSAEIRFLVDPKSSGWRGQRVELNAMTSKQFISWLERKLKQNGIEKVMPDAKVLADAYRRADWIARSREALEEIEINKSLPVPRDLEQRIGKLLKREPKLPWDKALVQIAAKKPKKNDTRTAKKSKAPERRAVYSATLVRQVAKMFDVGVRDIERSKKAQARRRKS